MAIKKLEKLIFTKDEEDYIRDGQRVFPKDLLTNPKNKLRLNLFGEDDDNKKGENIERE